MKESTFRIILGLWLLMSLYFEVPVLTLALTGLLLFEGVTNLRIPGLLSRWRGQGQSVKCDLDASSRIPFEAERMLRLIVVLLLMISYLALLQFLWWVPWFIGFALLGAGISGICPMVLTLRWVGFR